MTSGPLVSIVTPVYNGASFLHDCLESSLAQTYRDWEHVVVDNGSTDATPEILDRYARRDSRFRVFRNPETVGALRNHNIAVGRMAEASRYLKILHADDQLLPDCLERMVAVAEAHPTVGMVGAYAYWKSIVVCRGLAPDRNCFSGREAARSALVREAYPFWSPSCLLHRREAVMERERFYGESDFHADVQAAYEILRRWDFGFVHEPLTIIRSHRDSRTTTIGKSMKRLLASNFDLLVSYGPEFLSEAELDAQVTRYLAHYYQELAKSVLEGQGTAFWRLHRQALAAGGRPLEPWRLARHVAAELKAAPRASCRRLLHGFRDRVHAKA